MSILTLLENWKNVEHEGDCHTSCNWCSWYGHQRIDTRTRGFGNNRTRVNHPKYSFIKIGQNAEKSFGVKDTRCHSNSSEKLSANAGVKYS